MGYVTEISRRCRCPLAVTHHELHVLHPLDSEMCIQLAFPIVLSPSCISLTFTRNRRKQAGASDRSTLNKQAFSIQITSLLLLLLLFFKGHSNGILQTAATECLQRRRGKRFRT